MSARRGLDTFFCVYFVFQIPSTMFFDTQTLFPTWLYPQWLRNLRTSYIAYYRDPFMADTRSFPWFMAICSIEYTLEIPFYFFAVYAYYKGASRCPWIRFPSLMYSVHIATAVLGILFTVYLEDFSRYTVPAPRDYQERANLFVMYAVFLVVCFIIMFDTLFSSAYTKRREKTD